MFPGFIIINLSAKGKRIAKTGSKKYYTKAFMVIMNINLKWRLKLFKNSYCTDLFSSIVDKCYSYSQDKNFTLIFAFLPQKDDVLWIKKHYHFYKEFIQQISGKCRVFDLMPFLLELENLDDYYSDDNDYGGHYSPLGNEFLANRLNEFLNNQN